MRFPPLISLLLACGLLLTSCDEAIDPDVDAADSGIEADAADSGAEGDAADSALEADAGLDLVGDATDLSDDEALAPFPSDLAQALEEAADRRFPSLRAPGAAMYVSIPGVMHWSGAVGVARRSPEVAMEPDDRFRVGSVTKTFTAAAILQLVEGGVLDLDDTADAWVEGMAFGDGVTIRRLLEHTAGIFNYSDDPAFLGEIGEPATPEAVIAWARDHGEVFEPGTDWLYSNTGYYVLGLIIESATGQSYAEVIRERFLDPLEMNDSYIEDAETARGETVDGHVNGVESTDLIHMSWAWAAGALVSTGRDLCVWADALFSGEVVSDESLEAMLELAPRSVELGEDYGLGITRLYRGGRYVAGHTGSTMGFRGELFFDLETGVCVSVQTNDFLSERTTFANALWDVIAPSL